MVLLLLQVGAPIELRASEDAARPAAAASLRSAAQGFLAAVRDSSRYGHLTDAERDSVVKECERALAWLQEKEGLQQQLSKVRLPRGRGRAGAPGRVRARYPPPTLHPPSPTPSHQPTLSPVHSPLCACSKTPPCCCPAR